MQEKFSCELRSQPTHHPPNEVPFGWELLDLSPSSTDEFLELSLGHTTYSSWSKQQFDLQATSKGSSKNVTMRQTDWWPRRSYICTIFKHLMIWLCIDSICDSVNLQLCLSINSLFTQLLSPFTYDMVEKDMYR